MIFKYFISVSVCHNFNGKIILKKKRKRKALDLKF